MKTLKVILVSALVLAPLGASPIGRSGNGRLLGVEDGFVTLIPDYFPETVNSTDGSLRLMNLGLPDGSQLAATVFVNRFATFYPALRKLNRADLDAEMSKMGWTKNSTSQDPCIDFFNSSDKTSAAVVAVWGPGKGVSLGSSGTPLTNYAVGEMAKNLQLDPGACAWK